VHENQNVEVEGGDQTTGVTGLLNVVHWSGGILLGVIYGFIK
jgi:hypothetical protein